jgi:hypothetical protein
MYVDIMRVKYVIKCKFLKNAIHFVPSLVPFKYIINSLFGFCLMTPGTTVITVVTISALRIVVSEMLVRCYGLELERF